MKCKYSVLCKGYGVKCHNPNKEDIPYECGLKEDIDEFLMHKSRLIREMEGENDRKKTRL